MSRGRREFAGASDGEAQTPSVAELAVIVPMLDEEKLVAQTLTALLGQRAGGFRVIVVDNGSRDASREIVTDFSRAHPGLRLELIEEVEKGTGAAADTGMRHAAATGSRYLARTDADCLPASDWTERILAAFGEGLELVAGQLVPRDDEGLSRLAKGTMLAAVEVASFFGRVRSGNRGSEYLGPYQMLPGCNMAITAELYALSGGFPRSRIKDLHEDRALSNAVRRISRAYGLRRDIIVHGSSRRVKAWGLRNTLAWYADHRYRPEIVDIR